MSVSIKRLNFISPFKILLDTGDIVQARLVESIPTCSISSDKHGNLRNKEGWNNKYSYFINEKLVDVKEIKEFLKDKTKTRELNPY